MQSKTWVAVLYMHVLYRVESNHIKTLLVGYLMWHHSKNIYTQVYALPSCKSVLYGFFQVVLLRFFLGGGARMHGCENWRC